MAKISEKKERQAEAEEWLHKNLPAGSTVYTILTNVSASGMTRHIKTLAIIDGELIDIGWHIAHALDYRLSKRNEWAIIVSGCGQDMGYHLVSRLSYHLGYNDGKNGRPSGLPDGKTNCYCLNHEWR